MRCPNVVGVTPSRALLWRMRTSTLAIVVLSVVVSIVLILAVAYADEHGRNTIINWVNFGGVAMTFAGLLYAYLRSNILLRRWFQDRWQQLRFGPKTITIDVLPAKIALSSWANFSVAHGFTTDDESADPVERLHARTDDLLRYVNSLEESASSMRNEIHRVETALEHAQAEARAGDEQMRTDAEAALQQFIDETKKSDWLDLRWAIAGTFFQILGATLSLCT